MPKIIPQCKGMLLSGIYANPYDRERVLAEAILVVDISDICTLQSDTKATVRYAENSRGHVIQICLESLRAPWGPTYTHFYPDELPEPIANKTPPAIRLFANEFGVKPPVLMRTILAWSPWQCADEVERKDVRPRLSLVKT